MIGLTMSKKIDESGCDDKQEKKTWESSPPVGNGTIQTWRERSTSLRSQLLLSASSSLSSFPQRSPSHRCCLDWLPTSTKQTNWWNLLYVPFPFLAIFPSPQSLQTLPLLEVNPIPKGKNENKQTNRQNDNKHKVNPIPTPFITKAIYQTDTQQFYTKKRKQKIIVFKENVEGDLLLGRSLWWQMRRRSAI